MKDYTLRLGFQNLFVGCINGVVALSGFSYKKIYRCFAGPKKSGHNNKVTIRQGSTVLASGLQCWERFL